MIHRLILWLVVAIIGIGMATGLADAKWPDWHEVDPNMPAEVPKPDSGRLDCWGFPVQADAQAVLNALPHDPFALDLDFNGIACDHDPLFVAYQNGYQPFMAAWEPEYYPPEENREYEFWRVNQDYYGLSVEYDMNPNRHRTVGVYLLGLNVPPRANPADHTPDACYSLQAEAFAAEQLAAAGTVIVEWDEEPKLPNGDPAAYIWYTDVSGTTVLLNEELLVNGLAVYAGIDHLDRYADRLRTAQDQAIAQRVGLWGSC